MIKVWPLSRCKNKCFWHRFASNVLHITKGQYILKRNCRAADSPKKWTNVFVFISWTLLRIDKRNWLFVFWENLRLHNFVLRPTDLYSRYQGSQKIFEKPSKFLKIMSKATVILIHINEINNLFWIFLPPIQSRCQLCNVPKYGWRENL